MTLGRILVAFDGTAHARRASALALEIAERFHSHLTVVVVHKPPEKGEDAQLASLVPVGDDGRALVSLVDELREKGRTKGISKFEVVYLEGDVEDVLLAYLEQHPQDLAVVGSRGLSRSRRLLMGSVSASIVNAAPCPVLVVRAPHPRRHDKAPASSSHHTTPTPPP
ncbi:MAG: universal stress protein [Thermoplasmata archaeon]|nr:universal stress protein [Thermoplasmata archaeon]